MNVTMKAQGSPTLVLRAETAADLMTEKPVSIRDAATVAEAVALFTDKGFSAAPVIDRAGRPVGVVSQSDILVHDREKATYLEPVPEYYERDNLSARLGGSVPAGFQIEKADQTQVRDIMTPTVLSVVPGCPACRVVEQMLALKVHRLFVVDENGVLVGVISALDILRGLQP
jgi:CBS-domain-containing membrane protein